jgi:uncharacterized membrane protein
VITLHHAYTLAGTLFAAFALLTAMDRAHLKRAGTALFYGLLALSFLAGDRLGDLGNGLLVIALALLAGLGAVGRGDPPTTSPEERRARADRHGDRLFVPALIVPAVALLGSIVLKDLTVLGRPLLDPKQPTVVSLALGVVVALSAALLWLRPAPRVPLQEGRRLMDAIGWAAVLPQALSALGGVFAAAGVGKAVFALAARWIPEGDRLLAVSSYTLGMALLTAVMGNAFAAFPTMTAAIGLPLLVDRLHGDPAVVAAVGMLSGFCGTLMTPMAANFNVVPASLLELSDRDAPLNGVIRAQIPTALLLLAANTLLLLLLAFPTR